MTCMLSDTPIPYTSLSSCFLSTAYKVDMGEQSCDIMLLYASPAACTCEGNAVPHSSVSPALRSCVRATQTFTALQGPCCSLHELCQQSAATCQPQARTPPQTHAPAAAQRYLSTTMPPVALCPVEMSPCSWQWLASMTLLCSTCSSDRELLALQQEGLKSCLPHLAIGPVAAHAEQAALQGGQAA